MEHSPVPSVFGEEQYFFLLRAIVLSTVCFLRTNGLSWRSPLVFFCETTDQVRIGGWFCFGQLFVLFSLAVGSVLDSNPFCSCWRLVLFWTAIRFVLDGNLLWLQYGYTFLLAIVAFAFRDGNLFL